MTLDQVQAEVGELMDQIIGCFKPGVKITVIVRTPGFDERDFLMTDDELPEVTRAIERRAALAPAPSAVEPCPACAKMAAALRLAKDTIAANGWDVRNTMEVIMAALPPNETACPTCGGRGEIGGWDSGENAWRTESCPECSKF